MFSQPNICSMCILETNTRSIVIFLKIISITGIIGTTRIRLQEAEIGGREQTCYEGMDIMKVKTIILAQTEATIKRNRDIFIRP